MTTSQGIAEELRSSLSQITGLKVVGRTSSEAVRNEDAASAANKLGVGTILTGSIRQSPSTIRISAQLVDGSNGIERWSENYDRAPGDIIKIQTDIAQKVASALSVALAGSMDAPIGVGGTNNAAAQKLLLHAVAVARGGRKEDLEAAQSLADAALALDPNYAEAFVLKARMLNRYANFFANAEKLQELRQAALINARRALRIAPDLASAHTAIAGIHQGILDLRSAEREFRRALELAPGSAETVRDYAHLSNRLGRAQESLRLADQALARDPLNRESYTARFKILWGNRSFEQALRFADQVQQKSPDLFGWHVEVALCQIMLNRTKEAERYLAQVPSQNADRILGDAVIAARAGDARAAQAGIDLLFQRYGDASSFQYAEIHAQAGNKDRAFAALDRAYEIRDSGLTWLKVDALLDPLRGDPRLAALVKRIDFPT